MSDCLTRVETKSPVLSDPSYLSKKELKSSLWALFCHEHDLGLFGTEYPFSKEMNKRVKLFPIRGVCGTVVLTEKEFGEFLAFYEEAKKDLKGVVTKSFGGTHTPPRKSASFVLHGIKHDYRYSGSSGSLTTKETSAFLHFVNSLFGTSFNYVLVTKYKKHEKGSGKGKFGGLGAHSDRHSSKPGQPIGVIMSICICVKGDAPPRFLISDKKGRKIGSIPVAPAQVIFFSGIFDYLYEHAVVHAEKKPKKTDVYVSMTFRQLLQEKIPATQK